MHKPGILVQRKNNPRVAAAGCVAYANWMTTQQPHVSAAAPDGVLPAKDVSFLMRDELRGIRFALEYAKAELVMRDWHIRSTIVIFGGSRVPSPEQAEGAKAKLKDTIAIERLANSVRWYESAREFGRIASERGGALRPMRDNVVATGGGPGIMEAANRGASEAGAPTIGFNIELANGQVPNAYTTAQLTFRFHYFAMRKMHLAMRANALVIFPGGFGTLDELFEVLTLCSTGKMRRIPIVLFDRSYWRHIVNLPALVEQDMIDAADLELFEYANSAEEAWHSLVRRGLQVPESAAAEDR